MERKNGDFQESGHKKVNAITLYRETEQTKMVRVRAIEDYYDLDGRYVNTVVYDNSHKENKMLLTTDTDELKAEYNRPLTIHLPDDVIDFTSDQLTEAQLEEIKTHVLRESEKLRKEE